jgi:hypothetical protein
MNNRSRFALSHGQKAILWIGSFICLWQFLQVPEIVNALLDFYAAGIVPGTDIVLAPDTTLRLLFVFIFSVGVLLLYRRFGRHRARSAAPSDHAYAELARLLSILHQRHVRLAADFVYPAGHWRLMTVRLWSKLATWRIVRPLIVVGMRLGRLFAIVGLVTERLASKTLAFLAAAMVYVGMAMGAATKYLWRQVEPSIRQFDRWLEREINQHEIGVIMVSIVRSMLRAPGELCRRVIATPTDRSK